MGFGTLFIGYFFLINITYFEYTDIIGAMVMLMGLYKLSSINRPFRTAAVACSVFAVFSLAEVAVGILDLFFSLPQYEVIMPYVSAVRYLLIFILTVCIMRGIAEVADEVEATGLTSVAKATVPLTFIYILAALFELPFIGSLFGVATGYIYLFIIVAICVFHITNLITIYKAYMQICMPQDLYRKQKDTKGGFGNKIFDRIEERSREYNEYKLSSRKTKKGKK